MSIIAAKNTFDQYEIQIWSKPRGIVNGDRNLLNQIDCDHWIVGANHQDGFYDRANGSSFLSDGSLLMHDSSNAWNPCRFAILEPNCKYLFEYDETIETTDLNGRIGLYDFSTKSYKGQINYIPTITENPDSTFHWKCEFISPTYKCIALMVFWQGGNYPNIRFSNPSLKLVNHYVVT